MDVNILFSIYSWNSEFWSKQGSCQTRFLAVDDLSQIMACTEKKHLDPFKKEKQQHKKIPCLEISFKKKRKTPRKFARISTTTKNYENLKRKIVKFPKIQ